MALMDKHPEMSYYISDIDWFKKLVEIAEINVKAGIGPVPEEKLRLFCSTRDTRHPTKLRTNYHSSSELWDLVK